MQHFGWKKATSTYQKPQLKEKTQTNKDIGRRNIH